jgi:hypothetical protein
MNQSKYILILIILLFFSVTWNLQNESYIQTFNEKSGDIKTFAELLYYMNNSATGYSSIQNYTLVYLLPFLFLLQQFIGRDTIIVVSRSSSREHLFWRETCTILLISMVFATCHTVINIIWTIVHFPFDLITESSFASSAGWNTICLYLFYGGVGLLYAIIKNVVRSSGLGLVVTLLLVGGGFFLSKIIFAASWTPFTDLDLFSNLLDGKADWIEILWTYIKQGIILLVLYLIGSTLYTRKDFI